MSSRLLNAAVKFRRKGGPRAVLRAYSRRAAAGGPYRAVGGRDGAAAPSAPGAGGDLVWRDPGFELLAASGFPLFLRGNVGLAWYDAQTTIRSHHELVMEQVEVEEAGAKLDGSITLRVQQCPTVLRQTVYDLFPYRPLENSELSVISITLKPNHTQMRANKELETEKMAQTFLMAAKGVCDKLRAGGYWADFVNPFSGRPYLVPDTAKELYKTNERFRCLDFQIFEIDKCKVVSNEAENYSRKRFTGSLFTSAPCKKELLNGIFSMQK